MLKATRWAKSHQRSGTSNHTAEDLEQSPTEAKKANAVKKISQASALYRRVWIRLEKTSIISL